MRALPMGTLGLVALLLSGCATTRLPLCPTVAQRSYAQGQTPGPLNAYTKRVITARGIEVDILSPFSANFRGSKGDIRWLVDNYVHLVCSFEPGQVNSTQSAYTSCVNHAPEWIRIIRSDRPEHLMLAPHLYYENCIIPLN
ncbi:hypothetical protein [Sphingopyxis sp.]|uniref:hypothetical protein n=1 Tax=Sphingopyxis sp. TaxID=1908224 RepID=UPI002FC89E4D